MPITVEKDDPFSAASQKLIEALSDTLATITGDSGKGGVGAVNFYLKHGYKQKANYGPYVGREEAVCFSKLLA
ncbi:hypothetical protein SC206_03565 [Rouxiella sp. T17]|uniref:hypothetical protein n=1 Tax=Rouxiella sp. T17 TaxID=3085684 RepID=UPI002FCC1361